MRAEIAKDNHEVNEQFGKCIKFGVNEESTNRVRVNQLFGDEIVSFEKYVMDIQKERSEMHPLRHR